MKNKNVKVNQITNRVHVVICMVVFILFTGIINAQYQMEIEGNLGINGGQIHILDGSSIESQIWMNGIDLLIDNLNYGGDITFFSQGEFTFTTFSGNPLHADINDRIGIYELNPSTRLHVDTASGESGGIHIEGPRGGYDAWLRIENGGGHHYIFDDYSDSNSLDIESASDLVFNAGGANELMRINEFGTITMGGPSSGPEFIIFDGATPSLEPYSHNDAKLGSASFRWKEIWSVNPLNTASDLRLKKDITSLNYGIDEVMALNPVTYKWKEGGDRTMLGFIAQDLLEVIPEVVDFSALDDLNPQTTQGRESETVEDIYGVYYSELIPLLTKAIQDQQLMIAELQVSNQELQAQMQEIMDKE